MQVELIIPDCGESITQVTLGPWLIAEGEPVQRDQTVLEIETDKATIELPAPVGGVIRKTLKKQGETAAIGEVVGYMEESAAGAATPTNSGAAGATATAAATTIAKAPTAPPKPAAATFVMPAAQRELAQRGLSAGEVAATGPGGRLLKEDVLRTAAAPSPTSLPAAPPAFEPPAGGDRHEEIVPMTPIRKRIAERLVQSKQTMALLTTFNEIDMSNVMAMRKEFGEAFERKYGVRLGFMSFFVKAAIDALKLIPAANGEIRGDSIVYKDYYDISIAVQAQKGLVVPVIRNADRMSLAQIETVVGDFGRRAKENKLGIEELQGGTFTISNGGVFGSLMSTPIVNPPQTAILGMHAIQDRPVARDGQVVIRPMMYVALTYDHRLIDGRESVTFLKRVKECVENPSRMLLEV